MIVQYQKYVMILDLISFIDYIFILRGKEKNVNFDHFITIHNFGISPKYIRSFIIPLHRIRGGAVPFLISILLFP